MDIDQAKAKLEDEKTRLLEDLDRLGDSGRGDMQHATPPPAGEQLADKNEGADRFEELGERIALEGTLEERLENVEKALSAIADGSYGTCNVGGEPHEIPEGRLMANPAATTCIDHVS